MTTVITEDVVTSPDVTLGESLPLGAGKVLRAVSDTDESGSSDDVTADFAVAWVEVVATGFLLSPCWSPK